jgi:hypothetical protein
LNTQPRAPRPIPRYLLLLILVCFGMATFNSWADHDDDQDCHPNQPGCTPTGEHWLYFTKPAKGLPYQLEDRAYRWKDAWRQHRPWSPLLTPSNPDSGDRYDPEYVHPRYFLAGFSEQCQNQTDWDYYVNNVGDESQVGRYQWSVNGVVQVANGDCFTQGLTLWGQGIHDVKLEVFAPGSPTPYLTKTEDVRVRDYLIVLFGDSAASGEGAPEVGRFNTTFGTWVDKRCHRSGKAAVPLAVQQLEDADPHSTVTFLNFACSGATLGLYEEGQGVGILGPYVGIEKPQIVKDLEESDNPQHANLYWLPSQVDQLHFALIGSEFPLPDLIPDRQVDMLLTTGGINDVRFSALALACVLIDQCHLKYTEFYGDNQGWISSVFGDLAANIPDAYAALVDALEERQIELGEGLVMQYPGAFENTDGSRCTEMLDDVLPVESVWHLVLNPVVFPWVPATAILGDILIGAAADVDVNEILFNALSGDLKWTSDEIDWMVDHAMPQLDDAVRDGADAAEFTFIDGIQAAFANHGYCAADNWIQTARGSSNKQGPWDIVSKPLNIPGEPWFNPFADLGLDIHAQTKGLMHPGDDGYKAAAKVVYPHLAKLKNKAPVAKADSYNVNTALPPPFDTGFGAGVLLNDFDPDGDPVRALMTTGPKYGTATLSYDGHLVYTPNAGFSGIDSIYYKVTDGALESSTVKVTLNTKNPRDPKTSWNWTFPSGDQTPVVQIGGMVEIPVCNRCGDVTIRVNPELRPGYGRVSFVRKNDSWLVRYIQNGAVPPRLPWTDLIPVEIGRTVLGALNREGGADVPVRIEGATPPPPTWSWIFRTPEVVAANATTRFDVCDSCGDLQVRLGATTPRFGTVTFELDAPRNRWVAVYAHNPMLDPPFSDDGFGVEIGRLEGSDVFTVINSTRITVNVQLY